MKIFVSKNNQTVTIDGETCNFYESGIAESATWDEIVDRFVEEAMAEGENVPEVIDVDEEFRFGGTYIDLSI